MHNDDRQVSKKHSVPMSIVLSLSPSYLYISASTRI